MAAGLANGALETEIRETIDVAAAAQRLHNAFGGLGADIEKFNNQTDLVLWGDAWTVALRGPSPQLCADISVFACE